LLVPQQKEDGSYFDGQDPEGRIVYSCRGSLFTEANQAFGRVVTERLHDLVGEGMFVLCRVKVLPKVLLGIPEGVKRLGNGEVSGVKLVVNPQETTCLFHGLGNKLCNSVCNT